MVWAKSNLLNSNLPDGVSITGMLCVTIIIVIQTNTSFRHLLLCAFNVWVTESPATTSRAQWICLACIVAPCLQLLGDILNGGSSQSLFSHSSSPSLGAKRQIARESRLSTIFVIHQDKTASTFQAPHCSAFSLPSLKLFQYEIVLSANVMTVSTYRLHSSCSIPPKD